MQERRASPRNRTFKSAMIEFNRDGGISAIAKNVSESGAMLEVASVIGLPDEFKLFIKADDFQRNCQVVWRKPTRVGVRFL